MHVRVSEGVIRASLGDNYSRDHLFPGTSCSGKKAEGAAGREEELRRGFGGRLSRQIASH